MLFFKYKSKNYIKHFSKGIIWNELVIFSHDPDKVTNSFSDYKFFFKKYKYTKANETCSFHWVFKSTNGALDLSVN